MTSQDRQQFWQQHIDAWQASDASLSVWLGLSGITWQLLVALRRHSRK